MPTNVMTFEMSDSLILVVELWKKFGNTIAATIMPLSIDSDKHSMKWAGRVDNISVQITAEGNL